MTGGARPSAAAGGRAHCWAASWSGCGAAGVEAGPPAKWVAERKGPRRPDGGVEGPPPEFRGWAA
jgi:hypothetical protein